MRELTIIVAQYFIILSVLVTIAVFLWLKTTDKKIFIARLIIGGILALIFAWIARHFYYDTRPFVAGHYTPWFSHGADNGFVSDHTLLASFLAFTCYFYRKWIGIALLALAIGIGAARVYSGVHHWADIGSAAGISLLAAIIAWAATLKFRHKFAKKSDVK